MSGLVVRLWVFALASTFAALSGCSVYNESLVMGSPGGREDAVEDSPDAGGGRVKDPPGADCQHGRCWWSDQQPDGCESSGAPSPMQRPKDDDPDASSIKDLYLGWFRTQLGETSSVGGDELTWQQYGFDLDGTCTNSATCRDVQDQLSCRGTTARIPFDGELCRDNSFGSLHAIAAAMPEVGDRFGLKHERVNCGLWRGDYSVVMRVSGYNGQSNDAKVRLDLYAGAGLEALPPWSCPVDDFDTRYPHWRQSGAWRIDTAALRGEIETPGELPDSSMRDANAYVREGYLVATFPADVALRFTGDGASYRGFSLTLHRSIWTGKLTRSQNGSWGISDGLIGGRIRKSDFVRTFREQGLCEGPLYADLVGYVEESVDIVADENTSSEGQPSCDAISFAIGFDAAAMTPGAAATVPPLVECCPPDRPLAECDADCGDGLLTGTELCDPSIAGESSGACPTSCPSDDPCVVRSISGEDCMQQCTERQITKVGEADACCPTGANATVDEDCPSQCGNEIVESDETCDPPGSCAACATEDRCLVVESSGSAESCSSKCKLTALTNCRNGDDCCPSGCVSMNDSDCSADCGNGRLEENETCERDASPRCPESCDDGDVCTNDVQTGSAATCNVRCTHLRITQPRSEDGCCPTGANANSDSDCVAACGNGKLEGEEQCDDGNVRAGDGCSARCAQETARDRCEVLFQPPTEACTECACAGCAPEIVTCLTAPDERTRTACSDVLKCAVASRCFGTECYCGSADAAACGTGEADGPCRAEIESAAGTTDAALIRVISLDPTSVLGQAFAPRFCLDTLCRACTGN